MGKRSGKGAAVNEEREKSKEKEKKEVNQEMKVKNGGELTVTSSSGDKRAKRCEWSEEDGGQKRKKGAAASG